MSIRRARLVRHCLAALVLFFGTAQAQVTVLDFESPLPPGLVPMSYLQGSSVPPTARVGDQYLNLGIRIEGAALINMGQGHAASGTNGLAGIDGGGYLNYDMPVAFSFFSPVDGTTPATTNYFAYSPDLGGWSNNLITITAIDLQGTVVGQVSFVESGKFTTPLSINSAVPFHKIVVDQTLYNTSSGGIGIDLVSFGPLSYGPPGSVPTILDFESLLPPGLEPMSFGQGSPVPGSARVTDQYLNFGVRIENAALINLGLGHAPSGTNGLGGIDGSGNLNYDSPVSFSFFDPIDGTTPAMSEYFAYSPDLGGGSGNVITITAYDLHGAVVGQQSYTETGTFPVSSPLSISGIGPFHRVTIDQTLYNTSSGGIGIDLVRFGPLQPVDLTPPVITPNVTAGTPGNGDWYTSAVTVTWTVVDDESDVTSVGCDPTTLQDDTAGTTLTCSATSAGGTATTTITIMIDRTPPTVGCSASPNILWSPNHKLANITTSVTVTDAMSGSNGFALAGVASNEPDAGLDKSDLPNDIQGWLQGTADVSGQVRAERSEAGPGRTYTLSYNGYDKAGNSAACSTTVFVPHDSK